MPCGVNSVDPPHLVDLFLGVYVASVVLFVLHLGSVGMLCARCGTALIEIWLM